MPVCGKFELNVTTNTQDEMDKIAEAVYNGFAETVVKERVLWPQYDMPARSAPAEVKRDPGPELKRVTTKTKVDSAKPSAPAKKERVTGVVGRGRMGRT